MKGLTVVLIVLLVVGCNSLPFASKKMLDVEDVANIYFTEESVPDTSAYQIYKNQYKDEMAKVQYLVNLVRYSPRTFCRNNQNVKGELAGQWLDYKIDLYGEEMETVEDFIEKIASYSRKTGKIYYVILEGNRRCPMKQVYYNELERLHAFEAQQSQQVIMQSLKHCSEISQSPTVVPGLSVSQLPVQNTSKSDTSSQ